MPEAAREELRRSTVATPSSPASAGARGADARRIVGLDELVYVGEHGLELESRRRRPGASACRPLPRASTGTTSNGSRSRSASTTVERRTRRRRDDAERGRDPRSPRRTGGALRPQGARATPAGRSAQRHSGRAPAGERGLERALYARATTRPISTPSTPSPRSSSVSRSRSPRPKGRQSYAGPPTSWSAAPQSCSSCSSRSRRREPERPRRQTRSLPAESAPAPRRHRRARCRHRPRTRAGSPM